MDYDKVSWEIVNYPLPRAFWIGLWEVRLYLIRNEEFTDFIYGKGDRDDSLRRAFDMVDDYLKAMLIEDGFLEGR